MFGLYCNVWSGSILLLLLSRSKKKQMVLIRLRVLFVLEILHFKDFHNCVANWYKWALIWKLCVTSINCPAQKVKAELKSSKFFKWEKSIFMRKNWYFRIWKLFLGNELQPDRNCLTTEKMTNKCWIESKII